MSSELSSAGPICLYFLRNETFFSFASGAAARNGMSFNALALIGVRLHVVRFIDAGCLARINELEERHKDETQVYKEMAESWLDIHIDPPHIPTSKWVRRWIAVTDPLVSLYPTLRNIDEAITARIHRVRPDFVWFESTLLGKCLLNHRFEMPCFVSHHDWLYKINEVRVRTKISKDSLLTRFSFGRLKSIEFNILKSTQGVLTGSDTELQDIQSLGISNTMLIPMAYDEIASDAIIGSDTDEVRIVHLGATKTTANRDGLTHFFSDIYPTVKNHLDVDNVKHRLILVGETDELKGRLMELIEKYRPEMLGHIPDLTNTIRKYDIAIIPYQLNTGFRTKFALYLNHHMAVISYSAAIAGVIHLLKGDECVVVDTAEEFKDGLIRLCRDRKYREMVADNGKRSFVTNFTLGTHLMKYRQFIQRGGVAGSVFSEHTAPDATRVL